MTTGARKAILYAATLFAVSVVWFVWVQYRNVEIKNMIEARLGDRWTKTQQREWAGELRDRNPDLIVPQVP